MLDVIWATINQAFEHEYREKEVNPDLCLNNDKISVPQSFIINSFGTRATEAQGRAMAELLKKFPNLVGE